VQNLQPNELPLFVQRGIFTPTLNSSLIYACCVLTGCYKFSRYKTGKLDKQQASGQQQQQAAASEDEKPMLLVPQGANM
jgi:hypothetical protein